MNESFPPLPATSASPSIDRSRHVLFVDDDPLACRSFRHVLHGSGYTADIASSAREAFEMIKRHKYAVVVTDLVMPRIGGVELIGAISRVHTACAFMIVTGEPDFELSQSSVADAAVVSVMSKPWQREEILTTLARAFDLHAKRLAMSNGDFTTMPASVLVLEDDRDCAAIIELFIRQESRVSVKLVRRLEEAVATLHEGRFDAIVTDLLLPDARGADSVLRLRRAAPDAAIVVCSGTDDEALALQMIQVGAHDYLSKTALSAKALQRSLRFARQRRCAERKLLELARTDSLTGLENRAYFQERLEQMLAFCERHPSTFSVLYLDLDGFKAVNDELGHEVGDAVLREVATRLQASVRPYDRVARLGGDEFAILLSDTNDPNVISRFAERIIQSIARPVCVGARDAHVTVSVGAAMYPETARSDAELIRLADEAMYRAKRDGRGCVRFAAGCAPRAVPVRAPRA